jgi:hypothetical protein
MYNYKKNKLEQLKGFCAVVECGSITQAAKKLNRARAMFGGLVFCFYYLVAACKSN